MTDDRHPEELLAEYADGALPDGERAEVEAHLATCARCREEVGLAGRAAAELRAIPDEPVPVGVTRPVFDEIRERGARGRPRPLSQRVLWAAGGAIAAAFIGLLAVWVLPGIGTVGGSADTAAAPAEASRATAGDATGTGAPAAGRSVSLEHSSTDYDDVALQHLATTSATRFEGRVLGPTVDETSASGETARAASCLAKGAGTEPTDVLVRLVSASYNGTPALIGVYLTGPAPDAPAKTVLIWVVDANTCEFLSITQARI
jgi:hypothetical protein